MGEENYTVADVLRICRNEGCVVCTKTDSNVLRMAINEAMGRGYLVRSQPGVYRLTPAGYSFLDELERLEMRSDTHIPTNSPEKNKVIPKLIESFSNSIYVRVISALIVLSGFVWTIIQMVDFFLK